MNTEELKRKLDHAGVPEDYYELLSNDLPNEKLCLNQVNDQMWEVYYSEHGQRTGQKSFIKEEDACEYMYSKLIKYV